MTLARLCKTLARQLVNPGRAPRPAARQRGSVLVLASVIVVLLALLGAAYVQQARVDRRSTQELDNRSQDFNPSLIRFIGNVLRADIFNEDFEYLTTSTAPDSLEIERYDFPWTNPEQHGLIIERGLGLATEFINDDQLIVTPSGESRNVIGLRDVELPDGTISEGVRAALGGSGDDHWLASIAPDFGNPGPGDDTWPHITNLDGTHLLLSEESIENEGDFDNDDAPEGVPHVYVSAPFATEQDRIDFGVTDLLIADMQQRPDLFADADGDGVADSRWTYAPLPVSGGLTFVMALRIVDNSAKTDINTWTSYANALSRAEDPRWYSPADLDMSRAFTEDVGPASDGDIVLEQIQSAARNLTDNDINGGDAPDFSLRFANWLLGSRRFGNPANEGASLPTAYQRIGSAAERLLVVGVENPSESGTPAAGGGEPTFTFDRLELRLNEAELTWRGGLNRSSDNEIVDPAVELEMLGGVDNFWRQNRLETGFEDSVFGADFEDYALENPRLRLTTLSGDAERERVHLNQSVSSAGGIQRVNPQNFANRVREDFSGGRDLDNNFPPISEFEIWASEDDFLNQVAASLYDFRDGFDGGTDPLTNVEGIHGMEYLPFVSEVFVQARYLLPDGVQIDIDPVTGDPIDATFVWELQSIDGADPGDPPVRAVEVAIELTNPWPFPIMLNPEVELVITDTPNGAPVENWGTLEDILDDNAIDGQTTVDGDGNVVLLPNAVVTLLLNDSDGMNSLDGLTEDDTDIFTADSTDAVILNDVELPAGIEIEWPEGQANGTDSDNVEPVFVELRMATDGGPDIGVGTVTYQQFESQSFPQVWTVVVDGDDLVDGGGSSTVTQVENIFVDDANGFVQISTQGTANGFSVMTVDVDDLDSTRIDDGADNADLFGGNNRSMPDPMAMEPSSPDIQFGEFEKNVTSASDNTEMLDDRVLDGMLPSSPAGAQGLEPFLLPGSEVFYRSGDLFRVVFLGPTDTQTIAEVWQDAADRAFMPSGRAVREFRIRDFMLSPYELYDGGDFSNFPGQVNGPDPVYANFGTTGGGDDAVSWGTFFLDRVTTLAPDRDGVDNDGDNRSDFNADPDENLIPGRININTVTPETLARALPLPDGPVKDNLINLIIEARNEPALFGNSSGRGDDTLDPDANPDVRGIAYLGELLGGLPSLNITSPLAASINGANLGEPPLLDLMTDFNEYEQGTTASTDLDGLDPSTGSAPGHDEDERILDMEEITLPLSYLNQVASVRSDVFTVYVLVRGYPTANFGGNGYNDVSIGGQTTSIPIPSQEFRLVFTMDRSVVHEDRPQPRVISVARFGVDEANAN